MMNIPENQQREPALTYDDLLRLLAHDNTIKALLHTMIQTVIAEEQEAAQAKRASHSEISPPQVQTERAFSLMQDETLHDYFFLVDDITHADPALVRLLTGENNTVSQTVPLFIRIIMRLGQFSVLCQVWEHIAMMCKKEKRAATSKENLILSTGVSLCNCHCKTPIRLVCPLPDLPYDETVHARLDPQNQGEKIMACALMGLSNAAGALTHKPLVWTG